MSETIEGNFAHNEDAFFNEISEPSYYEESGEGQQIYLDSVLPQSYDPTLEPFNTQALNPKVYAEQDQYGFHPKINNAYQYTYDNTNAYFQPQNADLIHFD
tara:strand:- start:581 stop:883 length:303 start_codon:yes stop_codon:yes gene_type:complete